MTDKLWINTISCFLGVNMAASQQSELFKRDKAGPLLLRCAAIQNQGFQSTCVAPILISN